MIWSAATFIIALATGGWVSGRLSKTAHTFESVLHGLLTWVLFIVFNIYLLGSAVSGVVRATGSIVSSSMSFAGRSAMAISQSPDSRLNDRATQQVNSIPMDSTSMQARLDSLKAKAPLAEAKARQVGDDVAAAVSKASIFAFFALLLGAVVAGIASWRGRISEAQMVWHSQDMYHAATV